MQVIVLYGNEDVMSKILEMVLLHLISFNNSQEFIIVGLVASLYRDHFLREESHQMLSARIVIQTNMTF